MVAPTLRVGTEIVAPISSSPFLASVILPLMECFMFCEKAEKERKNAPIRAIKCLFFKGKFLGSIIGAKIGSIELLTSYNSCNGKIV